MFLYQRMTLNLIFISIKIIKYRLKRTRNLNHIGKKSEIVSVVRASIGSRFKNVLSSKRIHKSETLRHLFISISIAISYLFLEIYWVISVH